MSSTTVGEPGTHTARPSQARERLLRIASELFYREGIHTVGVDRVLATADVTRATLYRHFSGKEALVAAYLENEDETIRGYFAQGVAGAETPQQMVRIVIEGIADDIARYHTRGCPFINAAAEYPDPDSEVRRIVRRHRDWFRATLREVLEAAEHPSPEEAAAGLVLLRDAALVGGYLDGVELVRPAFIRQATAVAQQ